MMAPMRPTPLTDAHLDEIERAALTPHRQLTLPTLRVRRMVEEIRARRDEVHLLQLEVAGSKAIVDAVDAVVRRDPTTPIGEIRIERPDGSSFRLIDVLPIPGTEVKGPR